MRRGLLLVLALVLMLSGSAAAEENMLANGGFEELENGWPVSWSEDMWRYESGVSFLEIREGGYEGGMCAMVENVGTNDARFVQTVSVEPDTIYHLTGWVKAEGCDPDFAGASLSVLNTYATFPQVYDTQGEWVKLECWFRTALTHSSIAICARVGDYSADNVGKAYFDDLSLTKAGDLAPETIIIQLIDYGNYQQVNETAVEEETVEGGPSLLMVVCFLALLGLLWMMYVRQVPYVRGGIWLLLAIAALVRLYLMATEPGYATDMSCFYAWSIRMTETGPSGFYTADYFCDYPPGYMYLLWATGGLMRLFGVSSLDTVSRVLIKLMPMLADLGIIALLWQLGRKRLGEMPALLIAALYALSPAVLVDGAIWGQVDAVLALGLLATVVLAVRGNWRAALPVFTLTVLMKPQALMAGPIGLTILILDLVPWKKENKKILIDAGIGLGLSIGVAAVVLAPFLWNEPNPLSWVINQYASTLGSYPYATLNAFNLYYLIGGNWAPLDAALGPFSYGMWGTALMVIVIVGIIALYVRRRDRDLLPFACAMVYIGLFLFGVKMHERYLFPMLALLLYAYIRKPDRRLLWMFAGFSLTFYINCAQVLVDIHLQSFPWWGEVLSVINLALCGLGVWVLVDKKAQPFTTRPVKLPPRDRLPDLGGKTPPAFNLRRRDWALMSGLTAVYAVIAFVGLGSTVAPQSLWSSSGGNESVVFDLGEYQDFYILYYGGINERDHQFSFSASQDGEAWSVVAPQPLSRGDCFMWQYATHALYDESGAVINWDNQPAMLFSGRYVRMDTDGPSMNMMEVSFRDLEGKPISVAGVQSYGAREESASDPHLLVDESDTMPEDPSYYNGAYFDEIYHARTAYEHLNGLTTYEWTHPPLGKVIMMIGIKLFGMTPFGWRFTGTLAGVLMVPAMYLLGKLLFKRSRYAVLAAFVMAFDMMHLTQTRIATIDSYAVLFIILMYTCMFRYMQMSFFRDGWKTLIPLGLSGLFMSLGCASKWICVYAGIGLAVLFFWSMAKRWLEWRAAKAAGEEYAEVAARYPRYLILTLLFCVGAFIALPLLIYYLSYIPHFAWDGGVTLQKVITEQEKMLAYHANLKDSHAFQSPWYEWPLMLKPMFFYTGRDFMTSGMASTIMCMGNPAIWWVGLAAFLFMFWRWLWPHLKGQGGQVTDHRPALLLLSFAAQFLPWVLVPRSMFIYHYFGSLPFLMMSIVYGMEALYERIPKAKADIVYGVYMGIVLLLFGAFYPVATGVVVPVQWIQSVNWLSFLKLPGWDRQGWLYW